MNISSMVTIALFAQAHRNSSCSHHRFVPQTAGAMRWEVRRFGTTVAAEKLRYHLYWIARTSESDDAGQGLIIDKVTRGKYHAFAVGPPIRFPCLFRRAIEEGLPVVVLSAPLNLPLFAKRMVKNGKIAVQTRGENSGRDVPLCT